MMVAKVREFYLPDELYYDPKEHLWARLEEDNKVRVGLDMFGQSAAGTIAYIKIIPAGREAHKGRAFGSLEAGKYIGPLKAPVSGKIVQVNDKVIKTPTLVNTDPYGEGWFVLIEPRNLEADLADLVHGAKVEEWLKAQIEEYISKGWIKE